MQKAERFSFVCDTEERQAIKVLAKRLQRTESDTLRWLVRNAANRMIGLPDDPALVPLQEPAHASA